MKRRVGGTRKQRAVENAAAFPDLVENDAGAPAAASSSDVAKRIRLRDGILEAPEDPTATDIEQYTSHIKKIFLTNKLTGPMTRDVARYSTLAGAREVNP